MSSDQLNRPLFALVEDDSFMAELVYNMLARSDVDIEVFSTGAALFKRANRLKFKTIILDLSLPDIDGFDMMDKLAAESTASSLLLVSGHGGHVLRAARLYGGGIGLQVNGALAKPFTKDELLISLGLSL